MVKKLKIRCYFLEGVNWLPIAVTSLAEIQAIVL